jgi:hypothetical protein
MECFAINAAEKSADLPIIVPLAAAGNGRGLHLNNLRFRPLIKRLRVCVEVSPNTSMLIQQS